MKKYEVNVNAGDPMLYREFFDEDAALGYVNEQAGYGCQVEVDIVDDTSR